MPVVAPLAGLSVLALVLWLVAAALAIALIMRYIGDVFRGVPVVGGAIAGAAGSVAQAITNAAGKLESGIDKLIGAAWHALARYMDKLWNQIVHHSVLSFVISQLVSRLVHAFRALEHRVEHAASVAVGALPRIKTLEREFHGIEGKVRQIEREIGHGIGADVRADVKLLKKEYRGIDQLVTQTIPKEIAGAEAEVTQLENFIKAIPGTRYLDWAAGIVAAGLGAALWNLFKCPTFLGKTLGRGCGLWNGLEDLFGLFIDALVLTNICDVLPWIEEGFAAVEGLIVPLISDSANALCARPPSGWVKLDVAQGPLPPAQTLGTFGG